MRLIGVSEYILKVGELWRRSQEGDQGFLQMKNLSSMYMITLSISIIHSQKK
jgi:hypothetical protein